MKDLVKNVYDNLKESTAALAGKIEEYRTLETLEKSGIYSDRYLNGTLRPKMKDLKASIEKDKGAAIASARSLVEDYKNELRDLDNLHPEAMTEDAKFFTAGVNLNRRDLEAILSRNEGNATMEQMTLRYAEEHGVDMGRRLYTGHQAEIQEAENINGAIDTFSKWIDQDNGGAVLDQIFTADPVTW